MMFNILEQLFKRPRSNVAALDGLRALAILMVLLLHSVHYLLPSVQADTPRLLRVDLSLMLAGRHGVDLFFLLSGFLIGNLLFAEYEQTGRLALGRFYLRRTLRIFPAYYVMVAGILLSMQVGRPLVTGLPRENVLADSWSLWLYLSNYFPSPSMSWSWSLATEEQFYLLLPALLLVGVFRLPQPSRPWVLFGLCLLPLIFRCGVSLFRADVPLSLVAWGRAIYYPSYTHCDGLLFGVLCAYLWRWSPRVRRFADCGQRWLALGGAASLVVMSFVIAPSYWYLGVFEFSLFAVGGSCLLLGVIGVIGRENLVGRLLAARAWYPIARVSYGMYLLHRLMTERVFQWSTRQIWWQDSHPWLGCAVAFVCSVMLSYAAAVVLFLVIERPFLALRDRNQRSHRNPVVGPPSGSVIATRNDQQTPMRFVVERCCQLSACALVAFWIVGPVAPAFAADKAARLNVILISLDTVRPDHLSCYGYRRKTSPNLDRLAKDGTLFTQAFSQAPQTFPSHLCIFTSQYPTRRWIEWEAGDLDPSIETLTEVLKRQGYTTAAFVGFSEAVSIHRPLLASRPFQAFDHVVQNVELKSLPQTLFDALAASRHQPFFLFLHGYDAHDVHVLPVQYEAKRFNPRYAGGLPSSWMDLFEGSPLSLSEVRQLPLEQFYGLGRRYYMERLHAATGVQRDDLEHLQAVYDAQIYYLDQGLGQLFTALKNLKLMDRTLLVILSDHGEAFGEHGQYAMHAQCYDELTRIVLIVKDPRVHRPQQRVHRIVQEIDVMPTILDLLDIPIPQAAVGRSRATLVKTGRDAPWDEMAVSMLPGMRAIRTPEWKFISVTGAPAELYHVSRDRGERQNLIHQHPAVAQQLQRQLEGVLPVDQMESPRPKDPEQWMRGQGYW